MLSNDVAENPGPDNKVSDLTVFHWNARRLRNKIEYLETICIGSNIVCITESHLDDKVSTQDILIPGYLEPFRNDRNCFGGGVLIYIADYLHASRRYDLEFNNRELIWIAVSFPGYKILVCMVYRLPSVTNPFWDNFHYSVEKTIESSSSVLITGNMKVDLLIETNHRLNEITCRCNYNLRNCINEPTRFGALLDPIIYSVEYEISFADVTQIDRNISDHDATSASLRIPYNLSTRSMVV